MLILSLLVMFLWGSLFPAVKLGYAAFDVMTTGDILFFCGGAVYRLRCADLSVLPDKRPAHLSAGEIRPCSGIAVRRVCDYIALRFYVYRFEIDRQFQNRYFETGGRAVLCVLLGSVLQG